MDAAAPAAELLETAARLSRRFGDDPEYARAGGGNSSVKHEGTLFIKPSGVALAAMTPDALMPLALDPLLALVEAGGEPAAGSDPVMRVAMAARLRDEGSARPSVECVFHALVPRRYVIHTHPTTVNALTCATDGEAIARDLFGDHAVWIPYTDPGLPLAREIARRRDGTGSSARPAEVTLLQNHGLIVAGDEEEAIVEASEAVVSAVADRIASGRVQAKAGAPAPPDGRVDALSGALGRVLGRHTGALTGAVSVAFDGSADAHWVASTPAGRAFVDGGPLTPDQIVYAGSWPLWLDAQLTGDDELAMEAAVARAVAAHIDRTGDPPVIAIAEGIGVLATGRGPRQAEIARQLYLDAIRVGRGALALGGVLPMSPRGRVFIERWEAEAYRRGLDPT